MPCSVTSDNFQGLQNIPPCYQTRSVFQEKYNFRQRLLLVEESLEYFHQRLGVSAVDMASPKGWGVEAKNDVLRLWMEFGPQEKVKRKFMFKFRPQDLYIYIHLYIYIYVWNLKTSPLKRKIIFETSIVWVYSQIFCWGRCEIPWDRVSFQKALPPRNHIFGMDTWPGASSSDRYPTFFDMFCRFAQQKCSSETSENWPCWTFIF